jgi:hypothetical protein
LVREAAKVGLKINEQNIPFEKLDDKILRKYVRQYIDDIVWRRKMSCCSSGLYKKRVNSATRLIPKVHDALKITLYGLKKYFFCDKLWFFIVITIFQSHIHSTHSTHEHEISKNIS